MDDSRDWMERVGLSRVELPFVWECESTSLYLLVFITSL